MSIDTHTHTPTHTHRGRYTHTQREGKVHTHTEREGKVIGLGLGLGLGLIQRGGRGVSSGDQVERMPGQVVMYNSCSWSRNFMERLLTTPMSTMGHE